MRSEFKWVYGILFVLLILLAIFLVSVQGFTLNKLEYRLDKDGNALVTGSYNLTIVERIWLLFPSTKNGVTEIIRDEYGPEAEIITINDNFTQFIIPGWATVLDNQTIQTPTINFENTKKRMDQLWFSSLLNIDYSPRITTIIAPDESTSSYTEMMVIKAHTLHR